MVEKPKRSRLYGRPRHRWGIMLNWILSKEDVRMWTGLNWLRIGTSGGLL
jgi:hypothetical protein